ncbi:hypothetical protein BATDEDRAFT_26094 [Batrachochytrium dendrobatidis JAM81]|uniref:Uncharacterized protein n=1 Tax=Batrachochytrium dendrobatidis (strain JAM81 / FGSC 10211) TaxID=684364 RepID=F4P716_BATDJ|nr:uncharacterized protein BATDEDRAFT_26094 [Batrachochytrium dendrobatidis JAM81]EGF78787.1 hypothetical protein BATDEDRAFT_26094 [Batrachochytrium dendrobatidis JAM81]|eukprot:XP_006680304.1 hypothetical protein BATDEDRAFT_26094 [Batrachochytrium dendrobatidis JAM81]
MKLVDILLVLSVAATANAILISAGNDGSLQASGTFSQRTFDRLRKRLELSKEIRNKKRQEYHNYAEIGLKQWSALSRGKEIPESKHSLKDEIRLKQEYVAARNRVRSVRNELKKYMKRHGLEFQEPKADSD